MMLKGHATAEATAAYASRFPELPGNFRPVLGVSVSSIGIGTYLGDPDDETDRAYEEAVKASLRGGEGPCRFRSGTATVILGAEKNSSGSFFRTRQRASF